MQENNIFPFLWMRGESEEVIRTEMEKISESNIRAVCLEARPHPDFAGEGWWHDVDIVLDEAKILYKPIITTDYVSVRDQIEDGKSGMIVSLHAQAIADAIAKLYQNAQLCEELSGYLKTIPDVTAIVLQKYDSCFWGCKFEVKKKATIGVEKYEDFGNNI